MFLIEQLDPEVEVEKALEWLQALRESLGLEKALEWLQACQKTCALASDRLREDYEQLEVCDIKGQNLWKDIRRGRIPLCPEMEMVERYNDGVVYYTKSIEARTAELEMAENRLAHAEKVVAVLREKKSKESPPTL